MCRQHDTNLYTRTCHARSRNHLKKKVIIIGIHILVLDTNRNLHAAEIMHQTCMYKIHLYCLKVDNFIVW